MKLNHKVIFYRELATAINAGLHFRQSLSLFIQQENSISRNIAEKLLNGISQGKTLYKTVKSLPGYFTEFEQELFGVAEKSGTVDVILLVMADFYEKQLEYRNRLVSGLIYPVFFIHAAVCIEPLFQVMFLTGYTAGEFFSEIFKLLLIVDLLPLILYQIFRREPLKSIAIEFFLLVPLVGGIIRETSLERFVYGLSILYKTGIRIEDALDTASRLSDITAVKKASSLMAQVIKAGGTLADGFARCGLFSRLVVNAVDVAEKSGTLESGLEKIAQIYRDELDQKTTVFVNVFPKVIYILLSIYLAIDLMGQWQANFKGLTEIEKMLE